MEENDNYCVHVSHVCQHFIAAPDVSNMTLPRYSTGWDPDYESSLSSLISGAADSVMSDEGDGDDDDEDDESGSEADGSDSNTDDDDDVGGNSRLNGEAELWQGEREPEEEALSAEQQLQSLQTGMWKQIFVICSFALFYADQPHCNYAVDNVVLVCQQICFTACQANSWKSWY